MDPGDVAREDLLVKFVARERLVVVVVVLEGCYTWEHFDSVVVGGMIWRFCFSQVEALWLNSREEIVRVNFVHRKKLRKNASPKR